MCYEIIVREELFEESFSPTLGFFRGEPFLKKKFPLTFPKNFSGMKGVNTAYEGIQQLTALKALSAFSFASFSFLLKRKGRGEPFLKKGFPWTSTEEEVQGDD
jgi:hypothetical protein